MPASRGAGHAPAHMFKMAIDSDDGKSLQALRRGLVSREFETLLNEGNVGSCVKYLRNSSALVDLDLKKGTKLLEGVSRELLQASEPDDGDIAFVYDELKSRSILRAYNCLGNDALPEKRRDMSPLLLESITNMSMSALAPGKGDNMWFVTGVGIALAEFSIATSLGIDPLQTVIPATLGLFLADRVLLGGAALETLTRALVPGYRDTIVRHEAGHFLIAYLMGCPVQGCVLDPLEVRKYAAFAQGGTIFADPKFRRQMEAGQLTRSSIDRFCVILMAGIAAEAVTAGRAEGGLADENALIAILSTVVPPFSLEQIRKQARWAAVQAVLLIKEHRAAYDALAAALAAGRPLGACVAAIEEALAEAPLPADERMLGLAAAAADGGSGGGGSWGGAAGVGGNASVVEQLRAAYVQKRMGEPGPEDHERQRKEFVEKLEALRRAAAASQAGAAGAGPAAGKARGVWLRDLSVLRDALPEQQQHQQPPLDQVEATGSTPATAAVIGGHTVGGSAVAFRTAAGGAAPTKAMDTESELLRLEQDQARNAQRLADVEAKLRNMHERRDSGL
ncbi:unnamed protein product [Phaeothamnion confervicola]